MAATVVLTDDTISNNKKAESGDAIYSAGTATLTYDTLSGDAAFSGSDVSNGGGTVMVANSILVGPSYWGSLCSGTVTDGGHNVESDNSCGFGSTDVVNSSSINLATALAANGSSGPETFAIGVDSSAFEEVPLASCAVTTDERGDVRPGVTSQNCDAALRPRRCPTRCLHLELGLDRLSAPRDLHDAQRHGHHGGHRDHQLQS
jgi:hypothetical protein